MIPKIIHYVWVGNNPKPKLVSDCIESWKKYCPDYEIVEWNDDILNKTDSAYVKEAYEHKKWAFVSDYIRLYALYHHGGFYFDTDLELTQNIDNFREHDFTMGLEIYDGNLGCQTAFIGAQKQHKIISSLLKEYDNIHFVKDGKLDMTPNPKKFRQYFIKNYDTWDNNIKDKRITLENNVVIYPSHYFCIPQSDKENFAIHHFDGSWLEHYVRKTKLTIGKYALISIKTNSIVYKKGLKPNQESMIKSNERVIFKMKKSKNKTLFLIKKD